MAGPPPKGKATEMVDERNSGPLIYVRAIDGDCWFLDGHTAGVNIEWLVDSGAGHSLIDFTKFMEIAPAKRPSLRPCPFRLRGAGGEALKVYGEMTLEVMLGRCWYEVPTIVAELGNLEALLGIGYLRSASECQMDFVRGILSVDNNKIQLHERSQNGISHVRAEYGFVIPAEHEMVVSGLVNDQSPAASEGVVEPVKDLVQRTGLLLPRLLARKDHGRVRIVLSNFGEEPVRVKPGTILGAWAPAEELHTVTVAPIQSSASGGQRKSCPVDHLPEHLQPVAGKTAHRLDTRQVEMLSGLLVENQDVFVGLDGQVGRTGVVKHTIHTQGARPIKKPPRRFADCQRKVIEQEVNTMLERGIIRESDSPWASQVVLVAKKDGSVRFCVDFRHLNEATEKDAYPLPYISDCIDALHGAQWFSTLDLASGYWQVEVEAQDRPKTAFVTRRGLYEFNVMPFGLSNAPATFERLMEKILRGLQWETCLVYLDDIIVLGKTFEESLDNLETIFSRLREAGLKLKPSKCELMAEKVAFLGHVVGRDGIQCDPSKIEAVKEWHVPTTVTEVKSFMGLAGYYRKFIKNFSKVAEPLNHLTKKVEEFRWTESCQGAFDELKTKLTEAPIWCYPSREEGDLFILDTDASDVGVGAVLSQVQDGEEKVIAYASKTLSPSQRKYCVTYRELLAVVLFVKQFRHYLLGRKFKIRTDHVSLKWLMRFRDAEAMVGRWVLYLSSFHFEIEHRKGLNHGNADALSRKVPKRRMACLQGLCPECPTNGASAGELACVVETAGGTPSDTRRGLPSETRQGFKTGELSPGGLTCPSGLVSDSQLRMGREASSKLDSSHTAGELLTGRLTCSAESGGVFLLDQRKEVPSELSQDNTAEALLPGGPACPVRVVSDSPHRMGRDLPSKQPQGSLSPGQLACSEKVGPLLSRQKATRPSEYILGPLSSESEEEVEGGPPDDQPLRRAGSGSLVESCEPPKPHVRVRVEKDPEGGIGGETICPVGPELGVEVEERGGTTPVDTDSEGSLAGDDRQGQPNWLDTWSPALLQEMQESDPVIGKIRRWMNDGVGKPDRETLLGHDEHTRAFCAQWSSLELCNGLLYRKKAQREDHEGEPQFQLATPLKIRAKIFHEVHASRTGGHLGTKRVIAQVRQKFYWPRCKDDLKRWCRECGICAQIKPGPGHRAPMKHLPTTCRLDRVHIDVLGELPETDRGNKYILVLTDHFSKWAHAWALPNQKAQTVADALMTDFFMIFGLPKQIHTDQGPNFESHLFAQMCEILGIEKTRTTPYRPQSDGQVERYNRTLQQMLKAYVNDNRDDWDDHLPFVMAAYRATQHESTGCTPNKLFLHSENTLPVDLIAGSPPGNVEEWKCPVEYIKWTRQVMGNIHQKVYENLRRSTARQKRNYDLRSKPTRYAVGQFVWRWYPPSAKKKLGKGWVGPYKVVACPTNLNCQIQRWPDGRSVRVHVDHLKVHYGEAPVEWEEVEEEDQDWPESDGDEPEMVLSEGEGPCQQADLMSAGDAAPPQSGPAIDLRRSSRPRRAPEKLDL